MLPSTTGCRVCFVFCVLKMLIIMISSIMLSKINDKVFVNQFLMMVLTADIMDLLGEQKGLLVR